MSKQYSNGDICFESDNNDTVEKEIRRCRDCKKNAECGKTGFMEMTNCSGWESKGAP
jgi:hypothetical protein